MIRILRIIACACGLIAFNLPAKSLAIIDWLSPDINSCDFQQIKTLNLLPKPFVSEGLVSFNWSEKQIHWQIVKPYEEHIIVSSKSGLVSGGEQLPIPKSYAKIFMALLEGDIQRLQLHFNIVQTEEGVLLSPLDEAISRQLKSIRIYSNTDVKSIVMEDAFQDQTQIEFKNCEASSEE